MKRKIFLYTLLLFSMLGLASCSNVSYTITFDSNFGTKVENVVVDENELITEPTAPTREGYTFGGWYKDFACTEVVDFDTFIPTGNITIFAKWISIPYTITFESNGGTSVNPITVEYNTSATAPSNPTLDGHIFAGWYTDSGLTNLFDFTSLIVANITLYAKWIEQEPETPENPTPDKPSIELPEGGNETPTIYLAGDSTVKTYNDNQYIAGWGQYLNLFLDENVRVVNCAQGGRSSRSFINEGRLYDITDSSFTYKFNENNGNSIEDVIKSGDYLFIQFGHNDDDTKMSSSYTTVYDRMVPLGEPDSNGIYPVTPGTKSPTSYLPDIYLNNVASSSHSSAYSEIAKYGSEYYAYDCGGTYKWFLKQYIDFARAKGATPVLVTPVARVKYSNNTIIGGAGLHGENFAYVEAVRQLAEEENCLLIDLFADSKNILEAASSKYGNYLMALKPNDLVGNWPSGYDETYGNVELGYTGIEATHYNKYGSYLQAGKVIESILNNLDVLSNGECYNFFRHITLTPEEYIDPSNLISKSKVQEIENLFEYVEITNPNRTYPDPQNVISAIEALRAKGEVTEENYLILDEECKMIRNLYITLNIDDRSSVTNLSVLESFEAAIKTIIDANKKQPTEVVVYSADDCTTGTYTSTTTFDNGLKIVATSSKNMVIDANSNSATYNGQTYKNTNRIKLNGSATFGTSRYIEIDVKSECTITVICKSGGSDERTLNIVNSSNQSVGSIAAASSSSVGSVEVNAGGIYRIGSAGSGINVYTIIIEYFE